MCGTLFDQIEVTICPIDGVSLEDVEDEAEESLTGRVVAGRFEVGEMLGQGGMGAVYKARQISIDRACALKVLKKEIVSNKTAVKRFLLEAKATSRLTSPHTITIYDFGQTEDGELFIAMEYLKGQDLKEKLAACGGSLPLGQAIKIIDAVALSLAEAHTLNIVHRDLKPANIFLAEQNQDPEFIKVLDFGIARAADMTEGMTLTQTGTIAGTPGFMAPETIVGRTAGPPADVYALGVILYEMVSGQKIFEGDTPIVVMTSHLSQPPQPLIERVMPGSVPPILSDFVNRCLAKDPDDRPADAGAFRLELERIWSDCETGEFAAMGTDATAMGVAPISHTANTAALGAPAVAPAPVAPTPTLADGSTQLGPPVPGAAPVGTDDTLAAVVAPIVQPTDTSTSALDQLEAPTPPKKSPVIPIAAAAVVALGLGAYFALAPAGDEVPSTSPPATEAAPPSPVATPAPAAKTATPAATPKPAVPTPAPPAPAPVETVALSLVSQPAGATVMRGDAELGTTPLLTKLPKGDKALRLLVDKDGFHPKVVQVVPSKDQVMTVELNAIARTPAARIRAKARAPRPKAPQAKPAKPKPAPVAKPKPKKKSLRNELMD